MKKAALEESILKHLRRWHKTNIEEELMKARAYVAALIALESSAASPSLVPRNAPTQGAT